MKKLMLFFALLLLPFALLVAQEVDPPSDIFDAVGNLGLYMATLGGIATLSVFITGFVNGIFQFLNSKVRLIVSWVVPVLLTFVAGHLLGIGYLAESVWYLAILHGFAAGLIANREYDVAVIQQIVFFIETLLGNKTVKISR